MTIGLVLLLSVLIQLTQPFSNEKALPVKLFAFSICALLYYLFDCARIVEFDSENMYLIRKKDEEIVPLKNVYKIKLTMTRINNHNFWKIGYVDDFGIKRAVRILPGWPRKYFDDFKEQVKSANPEVRITNWSWSFDLDQ